MARKSSVTMRVDKAFYEKLRKISLKRYVAGKDKYPRTPRRITAAMLRSDGFRVVENELILKDFNKENGQ